MTTRKMIVNSIDAEEVRIAILRDRVLEDFDIESREIEKNKGNIYLATVMAVEPALNAAFVNYGADKQGFLTANDVHPKYAHSPVDGDRPKINQLLRKGQEVLVQVSKDEVSSKGAVLTTYLSLAGRYVVLMPDSDTQGISRKIEDEETRRKVREAAAMLNVPENMGVIIRTAGKDRNKIELNRDLSVLLRLWNNIQKEARNAKAPALIFKEQDVILRALRDYFSSDIDEIILDSDEAYDRASEYMHMVMPNQRSVLTRYVERRPIFHHYRVEDQLEVLYSPRVTLPSGGSLVIESTEALVAIDVNSGKQKLGDQEETALQTNSEAAQEIARQLRLRDLGGIIVIDFIDMNHRRNQQKVERALKEALRYDKARIKISHISENGTLELTRQRLRSSLQTSLFDTCGLCQGTGHVLSPTSQGIAIVRKLRDRASRGDLRLAKIRVDANTATRLRQDMWSSLQEIERRFGSKLEIIPEASFAAGQSDFTFETDPNAVVLPLPEPNFGPAERPEFEEEFGDGTDLADRRDAEQEGLAHDDFEATDAEAVMQDGAQRGRRNNRRGGGRRTGRGGEGAAFSEGRNEGRNDQRNQARELLQGLGNGEMSFDMPRFEFIDVADLSGQPRPAGRREARGDGRGAARHEHREHPQQSMGRNNNRRRTQGEERTTPQPRGRHHAHHGQEHRRGGERHAAGASSNTANAAPKKGLLARLVEWFS